MDLRCSAIGVSVDLAAAVALAARHGFESVTPDAGFLAGLSDAEYDELAGRLEDTGLVWGSAPLPVEFRREAETFVENLEKLPRLAAALQRAGVTRMGTWLMPCHDQLTYLQNLKQHAERLRACARILADHGIRLGLEYVGPKTLWASKRYPFVHTMAETRDLIAEIGEGNVGFVLDSWHWYTALETKDELLSLRNEDIVACDLNDAPAGVPIDEQVDFRRELPMATGVIDVRAFLEALVEIGYDGPIRAEPFNQAVNDLPDDEAAAKTATAMREAIAQVEG